MGRRRRGEVAERRCRLRTGHSVIGGRSVSAPSAITAWSGVKSCHPLRPRMSPPHGVAIRFLQRDPALLTPLQTVIPGRSRVDAGASTAWSLSPWGQVQSVTHVLP